MNNNLDNCLAKILNVIKVLQNNVKILVVPNHI